MQVLFRLYAVASLLVVPVVPRNHSIFSKSLKEPLTFYIASKKISSCDKLYEIWGLLTFRNHSILIPIGATAMVKNLRIYLKGLTPFFQFWNVQNWILTNVSPCQILLLLELPYSKLE